MSLKIKTGSIKRRRASIGELIGHSKPTISALADGPATPTPRSVLFDTENNSDLAVYYYLIKPITNTPKGGFFNEAPYKLKIATKNGEPLEIAAKDFAVFMYLVILI